MADNFKFSCYELLVTSIYIPRGMVLRNDSSKFQRSTWNYMLLRRKLALLPRAHVSETLMNGANYTFIIFGGIL